MIKNKIVIGSANLNTKYGLKKNKINVNEFKRLINFAKLKGINLIDTSPNYSNSEKIIGALNKKLKIITKIPKIPVHLKNNKIKIWIRQQIKNSLNNLRTTNLHGILVQNAEVLISKNSELIFETLEDLKKEKRINKIGVSIYNFTTLKKIMNKYKVDFIQVPFNIFDQRLVEKNLINKIKKHGIELHVRSIFLQGLLTDGKTKLPHKMFKLEKNLNIWKNWTIKNNISPVNACLDFVSSFKSIDKFVIGFNGINDFKEIINHKKSKLNFKDLKFKIKQNIVDPRNWASTN